MPRFYRQIPMLFAVVCPLILDFEGLHLQFPVFGEFKKLLIKNIAVKFTMWPILIDEKCRTLNFDLIGVNFSCNDLLHNSKASKSIGNLISFNTLALMPSLPLY